MNRDPDRKITVEDLIRLKRTERPRAEFWASFESQMRAKQLAAIVVKRPWWDGAARIVSGALRYSLPVAAAASVALVWVGIRYAGAPAPAAHGLALAGASAPSAALPQPMRPVPAARQVSVARAEPAAVVAVAEPDAPPVVAATSPHVTQVSQGAFADDSDRTPIAEGIYVTLADLRETAPVLPQRDVFGSDRDFESTVSARQQASDPLARMDPAAERRARLLAPALPAYASSSSRALTGSLTRERLNDDRIYESMDLYGSSGRSMVGFRF
jgi:hypothetical protein